MMADFAAALKSQFPGWTAWLLTSDRLLPRQMRLKESRKIVLFNGTARMPVLPLCNVAAVIAARLGKLCLSAGR